MGTPDPTTVNLGVYDTRQGLWNPDYGNLDEPDGWAFLPTDGAFLTRQVMAAGTYWMMWRPRGRNRPHRRQLGILASKAIIETVRAQTQVNADVRSGDLRTRR